MDPLAPLINTLHAEGRLRVWSLVITVFGDMVQVRGGGITTARLRALMERVGVEQGALRTALSRLARDGWVESHRSGRLSTYRLSRQGLDRFAPATSLIYAAPRMERADRWSLSVTLEDDSAPRLSLVPGMTAPEAADVVVTGNLARLTEAWRGSVLSPDLRAAYAALSRDLDALRTPPADPLDAAAARMLLIHRWRRIVLRHPEPPHELLPEDAPLAHPRAAVAAAYARLSPGAEAWLETELGADGPMPPASPEFARRFGGTERA